MADNLIQADLSDFVHKLDRSECTFTSCAPNVDTFGIKHQDPSINAVQLLSQFVETEFIIGSNKDLGALGRIANSIQSRWDFIPHPKRADPSFDLA
jgi:hypothetical protein